MSAQADTNCHDIEKKCRRHGPIWPKLERHGVSSATCRDMSATFPAKELARLPKLRPRTTHINVCYHHVCDHGQKGLIKILPIDTKDQIADALTKALAQYDFQRHQRLMCGK